MEETYNRLRGPEDNEIVDALDLQILTFNQLDVQKVFKGKGDKK